MRPAALVPAGLDRSQALVAAGYGIRVYMTLIYGLRDFPASKSEKILVTTLFAENSPPRSDESLAGLGMGAKYREN